MRVDCIDFELAEVNSDMSMLGRGHCTLLTTDQGGPPTERVFLFVVHRNVSDSAISGIKGKVNKKNKNKQYL